MKIQKTKVSRTVEIPGKADVERSTVVSFREAENTTEALALCGNDTAKFLSYFNGGRWAELRTQISNTLANKSPQQRAVDKLMSAFKTLNPKMSEAQLRAMALSVPGIADAVGAGVEDTLPGEIDDTYFEQKKAEAKADAEVPAAETVTEEVAV